MPVTILVPRGPEEATVRRAAPTAAIVGLAAGAGSAAIPELEGGTFAVLVGLCGSLASAHVGDIVAYTRIADKDGAETIAAGDLADVQRALPRARGVVACMTDRVVTRAAERAALAAHFGADVVDMEGLHVARALRARGIRFAMVRVVSDDPRADLPPIEDALEPGGAIRPFVLAGAFVRAPLAAMRFVRDIQASLRVLGSVAAALAASK